MVRCQETVDVLTRMNIENLWSFFFLLLMSSSADGWLLQKVPTALFIFSSSSPLNWKTDTFTRMHTHTKCSGHNTCSWSHLLQVTVTQFSGFFHLPKHHTEGLVKKILHFIEREKYWTRLMLIKTHALLKCVYVVRAVRDLNSYWQPGC